MIWKLLGALSGAALVGLWWLLVLEHPVLQTPSATAEGLTGVEETVAPQPMGRNLEGPRLPPAGTSSQPPAPQPSSQVPVESADPPAVGAAPAQAGPTPNQDAPESSSPPGFPRLVAESTPVVATTARSIAEPSWHPLWNPFRSRISAQGFADHLSRLSGRRFSVEHEGPGQYRVHLAYQDATDLQLGLALVEAVSGLSPEVPP